MRETFKYKAWEIAHSNLCFRRHLGRRILQLDTRTLELVIFLLDVAQKSGACPVGEYAVINVIKRGYLPPRFDKFKVKVRVRVFVEIWGMPSGIVGLKLERSHGLSYCRLGLYNIIKSQPTRSENRLVM